MSRWIGRAAAPDPAYLALSADTGEHGVQPDNTRPWLSRVGLVLKHAE